MDSIDSRSSQRRPLRAGPAQVVALGLVAASIGWAAWLLRDRPASEEVELLPGTVLPSSELAIVEAAFDRAQLVGHRTEDGRVWVSRPRQSAYMRALVDAEALPREFGSSLRRALEQNSPWQSRAAQEELLRVALQEELAHVICSMPGIERAAVLYDVGDRAAFDGGLGGGPERTASVNVRTQPDAELEPARVQAIRVLVASSIAGLSAERVAVTDLRSGRVHAGPLVDGTAADAGMTANPELARRIALERHLAAKVRQAVSFVKGAVVDVTVATAVVPPEPPMTAAPRQPDAAANAPAEVESAGEPAEHSTVDGDSADAIVVSLAVPETWFDVVAQAARDRAPAANPVDSGRLEEERLRSHVLQSLPPATRGEERRVVITRFPVAPSRSQASAKAAAAPASVPATPPSGAPVGKGPQANGKPQTLGGYVDVTLQAVADGRFGDVPREAWMLISAKCSALLAYLLYRGSHAQASAGGGRHAGPDRRIDWSEADEEVPARGGRDGSRRLAA